MLKIALLSLLVCLGASHDLTGGWDPIWNCFHIQDSFGEFNGYVVLWTQETTVEYKEPNGIPFVQYDQRTLRGNLITNVTIQDASFTDPNFDYWMTEGFIFGTSLLGERYVNFVVDSLVRPGESTIIYFLYNVWDNKYFRAVLGTQKNSFFITPLRAVDLIACPKSNRVLPVFSPVKADPTPPPTPNPTPAPTPAPTPQPPVCPSSNDLFCQDLLRSIYSTGCPTDTDIIDSGLNLFHSEGLGQQNELSTIFRVGVYPFDVVEELDPHYYSLTGARIYFADVGYCPDGYESHLIDFHWSIRCGLSGEILYSGVAVPKELKHVYNDSGVGSVYEVQWDWPANLILPGDTDYVLQMKARTVNNTDLYWISSTQNVYNSYNSTTPSDPLSWQLIPEKKALSLTILGETTPAEIQCKSLGFSSQTCFPQLLSAGFNFWASGCPFYQIKGHELFVDAAELPNILHGQSLNDDWVASPFSPPKDTLNRRLERFSIWVTDTPCNFEKEISGFEWAIWSNNAMGPGELLHSGVALESTNNLTRLYAGRVIDIYPEFASVDKMQTSLTEEIYQFDIVIPPFVVEASGEYWLALKAIRNSKPAGCHQRGGTWLYAQGSVQGVSIKGNVGWASDFQQAALSFVLNGPPVEYCPHAIDCKMNPAMYAYDNGCPDNTANSILGYRAKVRAPLDIVATVTEDYQRIVDDFIVWEDQTVDGFHFYLSTPEGEDGCSMTGQWPEFDDLWVSVYKGENSPDHNGVVFSGHWNDRDWAIRNINKVVPEDPNTREVFRVSLKSNRFEIKAGRRYWIELNVNSNSTPGLWDWQVAPYSGDFINRPYPKPIAYFPFDEQYGRGARDYINHADAVYHINDLQRDASFLRADLVGNIHHGFAISSNSSIEWVSKNAPILTANGLSYGFRVDNEWLIGSSAAGNVLTLSDSRGTDKTFELTFELPTGYSNVPKISLSFPYNLTDNNWVDDTLNFDYTHNLSNLLYPLRLPQGGHAFYSTYFVGFTMTKNKVCLYLQAQYLLDPSNRDTAKLGPMEMDCSDYPNDLPTFGRTLGYPLSIRPVLIDATNKDIEPAHVSHLHVFDSSLTGEQVEKLAKNLLTNHPQDVVTPVNIWYQSTNRWPMWVQLPWCDRQWSGPNAIVHPNNCYQFTGSTLELIPASVADPLPRNVDWEVDLVLKAEGASGSRTLFKTDDFNSYTDAWGNFQPGGTFLQIDAFVSPLGSPTQYDIVFVGHRYQEQNLQNWSYSFSTRESVSFNLKYHCENTNTCWFSITIMSGSTLELLREEFPITGMNGIFSRPQSVEVSDETCYYFVSSKVKSSEGIFYNSWPKFPCEMWTTTPKPANMAFQLLDSRPAPVSAYKIFYINRLNLATTVVLERTIGLDYFSGMGYAFSSGEYVLDFYLRGLPGTLFFARVVVPKEISVEADTFIRMSTPGVAAFGIPGVGTIWEVLPAELDWDRIDLVRVDLLTMEEEIVDSFGEFGPEGRLRSPVTAEDWTIRDCTFPYAMRKGQAGNYSYPIDPFSGNPTQPVWGEEWEFPARGAEPRLSDWFICTEVIVRP